ncbi:MAG: hypothetical protein CBB71_23205 [Rhodopirellula sp. TMED11]|nr:MAG: hypothetical protein CBB71_23205 [Rhodopirellula sp. TMED11]
MLNVLLAVDGSDPSMHAAELLAHLPHSGGVANLTVLTVVQRPFIHSNYSTGEVLKKAFERDKNHAETVYQQVSEMFEGADVKLRHVVSDGPVGESIVQEAHNCQANFLVIGARGHSQISRTLLGSVSDYVATHAPCSTMVVRPTDLMKSERPIRVLLAYEQTASGIEALQEVQTIPWRTGADFHVLTVETYLSDFVGQRVAGEEYEMTKLYEEGLLTAQHHLMKVAPKLQTHLVKADHVGEGIIEFAEKEGIDLLVIGEAQRSSLSRLLLGSTSRFVLRHAHCSVWVARNHVREELLGQGGPLGERSNSTESS